MPGFDLFFEFMRRKRDFTKNITKNQTHNNDTTTCVLAIKEVYTLALPLMFYRFAKKKFR